MFHYCSRQWIYSGNKGKETNNYTFFSGSVTCCIDELKRGQRQGVRRV